MRLILAPLSALLVSTALATEYGNTRYQYFDLGGQSISTPLRVCAGTAAPPGGVTVAGCTEYHQVGIGVWTLQAGTWIASSSTGALAPVATSGSASDLSTGTLAAARLPSIAATGATAARTMADHFADARSVRDFTGIDCTGATNSSSGFRLALLASPVIHVPGGCTLLLDNVSLPASSTIIGDGPTSVLKHMSAGIGHMLIASTPGGYTAFFNIVLDGNTAGQTTHTWRTFRQNAGGSDSTHPARVVIRDSDFINDDLYGTGTQYAATLFPTVWTETNTRHLGGMDGGISEYFLGATQAFFTNVQFDPGRLPTGPTDVGRAGIAFTNNGVGDTVTAHQITATGIQCYHTGISLLNGAFGCFDVYHAGKGYSLTNSFSVDGIGRGFTAKGDTSDAVMNGIVCTNTTGNPNNPNGQYLGACVEMSAATATSAVIGKDQVMTGIVCVNYGGPACIGINNDSAWSPNRGSVLNISNFVIDGCVDNGSSFGIRAYNFLHGKISNGIVRGCRTPFWALVDDTSNTGDLTVSDVQFGYGQVAIDDSAIAAGMWWTRNRLDTPLNGSLLAIPVTSGTAKAWTPNVLIDTRATSQTVSTIAGMYSDGEVIYVQKNSAANALTLNPVTVDAQVTGHISGVTFIVDSVISGTVAIGQRLHDSGGVFANTYITAGSGTTWTLNQTNPTIATEGIHLETGNLRLLSSWTPSSPNAVLSLVAGGGMLTELARSANP